MAGYECALCDGAEQATLLITPLAGGETMPVGEGCMAVAFTGMLAGHLDIDPDLLWSAVEQAQQDGLQRAANGTTQDPGQAAEPPEPGRQAFVPGFVPAAPVDQGGEKPPRRPPAARRRPAARGPK